MWSILEKIASFLFGDGFLIEAILLILIIGRLVLAVAVTIAFRNKKFACAECGAHFSVKGRRLFLKGLDRGVPRRIKDGELIPPRYFASLDVQCPECGSWNCGVLASRD